MKSEMLQIRVSPEIKKTAAMVFEKMGMSTGDAVNIFLHQVINTNSIPFVIRANSPENNLNYTDDEIAALLQEVENDIQKGVGMKDARTAINELGMKYGV